ncbi:MAG: SAM-dependent methyltransferase [Saprospiraceae bacterium]|nr:SAM-dependent methyltransferase [Saprospiraceae bacterium]
MSAKATFIQHFRQFFETGKLLKCTLSRPSVSAPDDLKNIYIRPVQLKKGMMLAFTYRFKTRDEVKNYDLETATAFLSEQAGTVWLHLDLFGVEQDLTLTFNKSGQDNLRTTRHAQRAAVDTAHNRTKIRLLDPASPWLHALGISNAKGKILPTAQDKWRQINKYLETIAALLREKPLPSSPVIADMGSGKGYLTFALYDFLKNHAALDPHITGIDMIQNLVDFCNDVAVKVGFQRLEFVAKDIANFHPERLDMLIALHACDTATDLALATGIRLDAPIIVAAPCCHKQIRREMAARNEMAPLLRHGILLERQAEMLTDGIRALLLESEGYQTKVFEFISTEHTPKNVMITAVRQEGKPEREAALHQVDALKNSFGISEHYLEKLLRK